MKCYVLCYNTNGLIIFTKCIVYANVLSSKNKNEMFLNSGYY